MTRYSNNAASNLLADCVEGSEGARKLRTNTSVVIDNMSITAEMKEASGSDYYVTTSNLGDGTLTISFDDASSFTIAGALALQDIVSVENKTQGWIYITKGATVTDTSILLVAANQGTGYPVPGATDEFEIVYRGINRLDSANTTLGTIDADTGIIAGDTTSLDTKEGTTGEAADIEGTRAAQLRYIGEAVDGIGSSAPANYIYGSVKGTAVTYVSSTTIQKTGGQDVTTNAQISWILSVSSAGVATKYTQGVNGISITESSDIFTISGAGTPFASGDTYTIGCNLPDITVDTSTQSVKGSNLNPAWSRYVPAQPLVSTAQELDATFTDMGPEIDMQGYNQLGLFLTVDIGTSTNVELRILHKHESAGTEEYREIYLGSPTANITTINLNDYQVNTDADQLFKINIPVSATTPYIQLQVRDAADGDGQIDKAVITKAWGN